jgi:hypothetical protein
MATCHQLKLVASIHKHPSHHDKVKLDIMFLATAHNMIVGCGYLVEDPRLQRLFIIDKRALIGIHGHVKNGARCPQEMNKLCTNLIVRIMQVLHMQI